MHHLHDELHGSNAFKDHFVGGIEIKISENYSENSSKLWTNFSFSSKIFSIVIHPNTVSLKKIMKFKCRCR